MTRRARTCPECGQICGHFSGCPETPDEPEEIETEQDETEQETLDLTESP